jgi:hypothetical protein
LARASCRGLKVSVGRKFVSRRVRIFCALLTLAWVSCPNLGASAEDTTVRINIGENQIGALPADFEFSPEGDDKRGSWTVVHDPTAKAGVAIEQTGARTSEDRSTLAVYRPASVKNAEIIARWTTGDSFTRFDSIAITPLTSSEERY